MTNVLTTHHKIDLRFSLVTMVIIEDEQEKVLMVWDDDDNDGDDDEDSDEDNTLTRYFVMFLFSHSYRITVLLHYERHSSSKDKETG